MAARSNTDDSVVTSMDALIRYATKYSAKSKTDTNSDSAAFDIAMKAAKDVGKSALSGMHKFFNKIIGGRMISAAEVCHHMLGLPEFLSTREFSAVSLEPKSRAINTSESGRVLTKSRYEKYTQRDSRIVGSNRVHPVSRAEYQETAFKRLLRNSTYEEYLRYFYIRYDKEKELYSTCFIQGTPKILMLTPFLSYDRNIDEKTYARNLRLTLKTYLVLTTERLTDAELDGMSVAELEAVFADKFKKLPPHLQKRWKKAQEKYKRQLAKKE